MPPKQKISKELILKAAYQIVRENGIDAVNARKISQALSCSTQPVYSCFATMEQLRKSVFEYSCNKFCAQVTDNQDDPNFLSLSAKWYLRLMRAEPNLYRMLYFSDGFNASKLSSLISSYTSNDVIVAKMSSIYRLDEDSCRQILMRTFALLHGIGALVAFNSFEISDDEIIGMVKQTAAEMVHAAKAQRGEATNEKV